jgi:hypothetical protein
MNDSPPMSIAPVVMAGERTLVFSALDTNGLLPKIDDRSSASERL